MVRFVVKSKSGDTARFNRAPVGSAEFVNQRKGFRLLLGFPAY